MTTKPATLYEWLRWFDLITLALGQHRFLRMVRS